MDLSFGMVETSTVVRPVGSRFAKRMHWRKRRLRRYGKHPGRPGERGNNERIPAPEGATSDAPRGTERRASRTARAHRRAAGPKDLHRRRDACGTWERGREGASGGPAGRPAPPITAGRQGAGPQTQPRGRAQHVGQTNPGRDAASPREIHRAMGAPSEFFSPGRTRGLKRLSLAACDRVRSGGVSQMSSRSECDLLACPTSGPPFLLGEAIGLVCGLGRNASTARPHALTAVPPNCGHMTIVS